MIGDAPPAIGPWRRWAGRAVTLLCAIPVGGTVAGQLGSLHWTWELATHLRPQWAALAALLALGGLLLRARPAVALGALALLANVPAILPFFPRAGLAVAVEGRATTLLYSNVELQNPDRRSLPALIRAEQPDLLAVTEVDEEWNRDLEEVTGTYPHHCLAHGMALHARRPLLRCEALPLTLFPTILARVELDGTEVLLLFAHPPAPTSEANRAAQTQVLEQLAGLAGSSAGPVLVFGDLNSSSWTGAFERLLEVGRLADSRAGRGLQASWPTGAPLFRVPIDHVLSNEALVVTSRSLGPDVGSDHLPVRAAFVVRR